MPATCRSRRHVVEIVDTPDRKGYVAITLDKGKIPPLIRDLRQIENAAGVFQRLYGLRGLDRNMRIVSHLNTP